MSERLVIVDYGSGNLRSAERAFTRMASETGAPIAVALSDSPDAIASADRIVLPGVGAFADCRRGLDAVPGLVEALRLAVEKRAIPFLGICVGMQLMASRGLEKDVTEGLDWIKGDVARLEPSDATLKIPQIGWNTIDANRPHPLLSGIPTGSEGLHAYFVHSYALKAEQPDDVLATVDYGGHATAIVARGNMAGTQFHPEKSQRLGLSLIANFLAWKP